MQRRSLSAVERVRAAGTALAEEQNGLPSYPKEPKFFSTVTRWSGALPLRDAVDGQRGTSVLWFGR